jgi:glutamyl-tRNA reductase
VSELDGVILYDVDDLQSVVSANVAYRLEQADKAKSIIDGEVRSFAAVLRTDGVSDVIALLCSELNRIGDEECRRTLGKLEGLSEEQKREVGMLAHRIVNKILHPPIKSLKESARGGAGAQAEQSARKLFGL